MMSCFANQTLAASRIGQDIAFFRPEESFFSMLPPGKRGRREFPKLPTSHANRRAGLCAAVVHHHFPQPRH